MSRHLKITTSPHTKTHVECVESLLQCYIYPTFWNPSPWLRPLSTKVGRFQFHSGEPRLPLQPATTAHCNGLCRDRTWITHFSVQHLNHWAIKVPEWPSRLFLADYNFKEIPSFVIASCQIHHRSSTLFLYRAVQHVCSNVISVPGPSCPNGKEIHPKEAPHIWG